MRAFPIACLLSAVLLIAQDAKKPLVDYQTARAHELKPHRVYIPVEGARAGFNQLDIKLIVSPAGDVLGADPTGDRETMKFWPQVADEVQSWKFKPFVEKGQAVTARVQEYVNLVPRERIPEHLVTPPPLGLNSNITITLERTACFGTCPAYTVTISGNGIEFDGKSSVARPGKHTSPVDPSEVRKLAQRFVDAQFYSMESEYIAGVTDCPTYLLTIDIDGRAKKVTDYMGQWTGMPAVIAELEDDVDTLARTDRWIKE